MKGRATLPPGLLMAWYGDDFTGAAAVMEVMTFSGLPAVLFLDVPSLDQLAKFPGYRAYGIAGTARSRSPEWMEAELPRIFHALKALGAPLVHYKICSTLDSSPAVGSIGKAIDIGASILDFDWIPLLIGAPAMGRYQAFGNVFASVDGVGYRLDRHPTMSRHPATPMDEADVRLHLGKQTQRRIGLIDLAAMKTGTEGERLAQERQRGAEIIALDIVDHETLTDCGRLIWEGHEGTRFVVGSQGIEYALVAHWQARGLLDKPVSPPTAGVAECIAAVSGSCSPDTARQIQLAVNHGFKPIRVDPLRAVVPEEWDREIERSARMALKAIGEGQDPILFTALGPDDPVISAFNEITAACDRDVVNARVGSGLGMILDRILRDARIGRCVIAGGDTSGHATIALGIHALTAMAYTAPGASLFRAFSDDPVLSEFEIALKGGQMGTPDYFREIKQGGFRAAK